MLDLLVPLLHLVLAPLQIPAQTLPLILAFNAPDLHLLQLSDDLFLFVHLFLQRLVFVLSQLIGVLRSGQIVLQSGLFGVEFHGEFADFAVQKVLFLLLVRDFQGLDFGLFLLFVLFEVLDVVPVLELQSLRFLALLLVFFVHPRDFLVHLRLFFKELSRFLRDLVLEDRFQVFQFLILELQVQILFF